MCENTNYTLTTYAGFPQLWTPEEDADDAWGQSAGRKAMARPDTTPSRTQRLAVWLWIAKNTSINNGLMK